MYMVIVKRKIERDLKCLPMNVQEAFLRLHRDLKMNGPIQPYWPNFKRLANSNYHCHLNFHYVACWHCENKSIIIEVYYVGSREGAPY